MVSSEAPLEVCDVLGRRASQQPLLQSIRDLLLKSCNSRSTPGFFIEETDPNTANMPTPESELFKAQKPTVAPTFNGVDFDDLLVWPVRLLEQNEVLKKQYQDKFKYIHIDEYQDTNALQYKLGKLLTSEARNICVVGDSDQNIYSWRGANLRNILNFERGKELF